MKGARHKYVNDQRLWCVPQPLYQDRACNTLPFLCLGSLGLLALQYLSGVVVEKREVPCEPVVEQVELDSLENKIQVVCILWHLALNFKD